MWYYMRCSSIFHGEERLGRFDTRLCGDKKPAWNWGCGRRQFIAMKRCIRICTALLPLRYMLLCLVLRNVEDWRCWLGSLSIHTFKRWCHCGFTSPLKCLGELHELQGLGLLGYLGWVVELMHHVSPGCCYSTAKKIVIAMSLIALQITFLKP